MIRSKGNQTSTLSIKEIQSFVRKMNNLQSSISKLVREFVQKHNYSNNHTTYKSETKNHDATLSPHEPQNPQKLNLLKFSADNCDEFNGCSLSDVELERESKPNLNPYQRRRAELHFKRLYNNREAHKLQSKYWKQKQSQRSDSLNNIEMKETGEFEEKETVSQLDELTAKYYHDNYYGQNGMIIIKSVSDLMMRDIYNINHPLFQIEPLPISIQI